MENGCEGDIPDLLRDYDGIKPFRTNDGGKLLLMPTCTVSQEMMDPQHWVDCGDVGNVRIVTQVELPNRQKTRRTNYIFLKGVEYSFCRNPGLLNDGIPWETDTGPPIDLDGPEVEKQSIAELIVLMELYRLKIAAEIPQALLITREEEFFVITGEVKGKPGKNATPKHVSKLKKLGRNNGFEPIDINQGNVIIAAKGPTIIDTNRWNLREKTDPIRKPLIQLIKSYMAAESTETMVFINNYETFFRIFSSQIIELAKKRGAFFKKDSLPLEKLAILDSKSKKSIKRNNSDAIEIYKRELLSILHESGYISFSQDKLFEEMKNLNVNLTVCRMLISDINAKSEMPYVLIIDELNGDTHVVVIEDFHSLPGQLQEMLINLRA